MGSKPSLSQLQARSEKAQAALEEFDKTHRGLEQRAEDAKFLYRELSQTFSWANSRSSTVPERCKELLALALGAAMIEYDRLNPLAQARKKLNDKDINLLRALRKLDDQTYPTP